MSAGWYYITNGWLRKGRRAGPLSESELLAKIDQGKIEPETLLLSEKTKGKWIPMSSVGPAMDRWQSTHPADVPSDESRPKKTIPNEPPA